MSENEIIALIKELQISVDQLKKIYPHRNFTLDGRLIGDIGEVYCERVFNIELFKGQKNIHDAFFMKEKEKMVQIKTTFKKSLTFPCDPKKKPQFYLGIQYSEVDGFCVVYNGPGEKIAEHLKKRKRTANGYWGISVNQLKKLNEEIPENERVPRKE